MNAHNNFENKHLFPDSLLLKGLNFKPRGTRIKSSHFQNDFSEYSKSETPKLEMPTSEIVIFNQDIHLKITSNLEIVSLRVPYSETLLPDGC